MKATGRSATLPSGSITQRARSSRNSRAVADSNRNARAPTRSIDRAHRGPLDARDRPDLLALAAGTWYRQWPLAVLALGTGFVPPSVPPAFLASLLPSLPSFLPLF